jgi:hypothetical protein
VLNKIIIRYADGKIISGTTQDFFPNKETFHVIDSNDRECHEVSIKNLKAVFFVKTFEGNAEYQDKDDIERSGFGRKIKVLFKDGETLVGYTQGFSPNRSGFILFPSDPDSNNDKVFVVTAATEQIDFI